MAARIDNRRVQLVTRTGLDWTDKYPSAVAALASLNVKGAYLDGELCGVDESGLPSFARLRWRPTDRRMERVRSFSSLGAKALGDLLLVHQRAFNLALASRGDIQIAVSTLLNTRSSSRSGGAVMTTCSHSAKISSSVWAKIGTLYRFWYFAWTALKRRSLAERLSSVYRVMRCRLEPLPRKILP